MGGSLPTLLLWSLLLVASIASHADNPVSDNQQRATTASKRNPPHHAQNRDQTHMKLTRLGLRREILKSSLLPRPTKPLILVPGVGGSILEVVEEGGEPQHIWLTILDFPEWKLKKYLFSEFNYSTNETTCLVPNTYVQVPTKDYGLYGITNLDPYAFVKKDMIDYYKDAIDYLKSKGYVAGKTLFGFPYDWRQSNHWSSHTEKLHALVKKAMVAANSTQVDIMSHSMGGLVVKSWLAKHSDAVDLVHTWVTAGTPFEGGGGKSVKAVIEGENFGIPDIVMSKDAGHNLFLQSPAMYELLPSPKGHKITEPWISYVKHDERKQVGVSGLASLLKGINQLNEIEYYNDTKVTLPFNHHFYKMAETAKLARDKAPTPRYFFNMVGTNIETGWNLTFSNNVKDETELFGVAPTVSFVAGDETVPYESSIADGLNATYRTAFKATHQNLVKHKPLLRSLHLFLGLACQWDGLWSIKEVSATGTWTIGTFRVVQRGWLVQVVNSTELTFSGHISGYGLTGALFHSIVRGVTEFNIADDCQSFDGELRPEDDKEVLQWKGTAIKGSDCTHGTTRECPVANGDGVQKCWNGYWSGTCHITKCDTVATLYEDFRTGNFSCLVPQPTPSGDGGSDGEGIGFVKGLVTGLAIIGCPLLIYYGYRYYKRRQYPRLADERSGLLNGTL